jgi:hypothetical protein
LKAGFSSDSLLTVLKDLSSLLVSLGIFYIVEGMFRKSDFTKAADRAITKIRQKYETVFAGNTVKSEKENAEECLFFAKPQTSFIPLHELRQGILEIRISYGTLANFETVSPKDTAGNEIRIANKKKLVKDKTVEMLQTVGAKFKVLDSKDAAMRIQFLPQSNYERILENVINEVIVLLKDKNR